MKQSERDKQLIAEALRLLEEAEEPRQRRDFKGYRDSKILLRGWKRLAGM